jgi:hypothetical protein
MIQNRKNKNRSLLESGQTLVDGFEILLNTLNVVRELGLRLVQQLLVVAQADLKLLLNRVQLGQSLAELQS